MENSYKELENRHSEFIELLDPENKEDLVIMKTADSDMDVLYS
jgi:hypothetical protein